MRPNPVPRFRLLEFALMCATAYAVLTAIAIVALLVAQR